MTASFSVVDEHMAQEITCAICLEPWTDPVEISPCRHVFCKECCSHVEKCPDCRGAIQGRQKPNRILVNMSQEIQMKCDRCGWTGSRETTKSHLCDKNEPSPSRTPPPVPLGPAHQAILQQQQQQQHAAPPQQNNHQPAPPTTTTWTCPICTLVNNASAAACDACSSPSPQQHQVAGPTTHHQNPPHRTPPQPTTTTTTAKGPWSKYNLKQEEYDKIMCMFMTFDTDGSGELDRSELLVVCRWLNFPHAPHDLDRMFRAMDTDRSGSLSLDEFCCWLASNRPDPTQLYGLTEDQYHQILFQFHTFDTDNDGLLSGQEFSRLCLAHNYARDAQDARRIFAEVDADRSGQVDLHEWLSHQFRARGVAARPPGPPPGWQ